MKRKLSIFVLLLLCFMTVFSATPIFGAESFQTYTYSSDGYALHSPAAYWAQDSIDSADIGLEIKIDEATDLFVDKQNRVYIADTANSRIVVTDPNYKLLFTLDTFVNGEGVDDSLDKAQGVFVNDKHIYVCDTNNERIVRFDLDGNFDKVIEKPKSALFGTDSVFMPIAMAVDQYGRLYVVSSQTNQGVVVMDENGNFNGFIGAQKVSYDIITIIWRRFQTAEQRAQAQTFVPTSFNNIAIDDEGFIYVTISSISETDQMGAITSKNAAYSPIKKLNSSGDEIMNRNGFFDPSGEVDIQTVSTALYSGVSKIVDVGCGPEGTWSIIDSKRSKVFTYDANGNLLFAFGDVGAKSGAQIGNLVSVGAVAYQGSNLLILDKEQDCFTVFQRTTYGNLLIEALACENNREHDKAIDSWMAVLRQNNNFDTAYIGIGKALYNDSDYEGAMEYLRSAYETDYYSKAYSEIRKTWMADFFLLIPIGIIAIVVAWSFAMKYVKRVNYATAHSRAKRTYWQELLYSFHLVYHPFDGFWDLKHEKRGSLRAALTLLGIVILCFFYQAVGTGYLLNPKDTYSTIFVQIISVCVPLILWAISNWCLTTLFDGEGSMKDIIIACCYALAPLPLLLIISTLASNFVALGEAQIVSLLVVVGFIWAIGLIFFGMMVTHDYSLYKTILTTLGTILAMAIIMFVAVLFTSLLGKILSFVTSIVTELSYRVV